MKLVHQIAAAILGTLLLVVAIVGVWTYLSVQRGFARYVRGLEEARLQGAAGRLARIYARDQGWDALRGEPRRLGRILRGDEGPGDGPQRRQEPPHRRRGADPARLEPLDLPGRATLYDARRSPLIGGGRFDGDATKVPLWAGGEIVGWLGVRALPGDDRDFDVFYLRQARVQLLLIAALAVLIGLAAGGLLTRRILRPIGALSAGARRLAAGDYTVRIGGKERDELGGLARDFDSLAGILEHEARARRRWVADTSHELRTPLTVLRAEVEAILDGVRPADPRAISSLHSEIIRLSKLVEDLGVLASSDRGALSMNLAAVDGVALLHRAVDAFRLRFAQRRIAVEVDTAAAPRARIRGDALRLEQVFANLLENSLRYTDAGGVLRVVACSDEAQLLLRFDDSAPGVPAEALPRLFERFYRVDASRSREHGGAGLGLSICQRLVEAHEGALQASQSPLGGLRMELRFPLLKDEETRAS